METTKLPGGLMLMPAKPGCCAICATDHKPHLAHNLASLFYGMRFKGLHGRDPTWADACAHLTASQRHDWRTALGLTGHKWIEPEDGEPIAEPYEVSGAEISQPAGGATSG